MKKKRVNVVAFAKDEQEKELLLRIKKKRATRTAIKDEQEKQLLLKMKKKITVAINKML
jgi:hypothetical protein